MKRKDFEQSDQFPFYMSYFINLAMEAELSLHCLHLVLRCKNRTPREIAGIKFISFCIRWGS